MKARSNLDRSALHPVQPSECKSPEWRRETGSREIFSTEAAWSLAQPPSPRLQCHPLNITRETHNIKKEQLI